MTQLRNAVVVLAVLVSVCFAAQLKIIASYPDSQLGSNALFIRGDGLGLSWNSGKEMEKTASNRWELTLDFDLSGAPQNLSFKTLVADAKWQIGANEVVVLSGGAALQKSVYPFFFTTEGRYFVVNQLYSPELNNSRDVVIYVPPSFDENPFKQYELLVMHDGQNLFNASTSAFGTAWQCQDTLNPLIAAGQMREIVIVGYGFFVLLVFI